MGFNHLKWFDKNGNNCTPKYDNGVYKFDIFFDKVSTNLFETAHLFVFEDCYERIEEEADLNIQSTPYKSLLIKFLLKIEELGSASSSDLQSIFIIDNIAVDEPDNFYKKYQQYVEKFYNNNVFYYKLTYDGIIKVREYKESLDRKSSETFGYKTKYVRPRANYLPEDNEESYLIYKWRDDDVDDKIFTFLIDSTDKTNYFKQNKSTCIDKGETFLGFVPVYNKYLNFDSIQNPYWKTLFVPYEFEPGNRDEFFKNDTNKKRVLSLDEINPNNTPFQFNFAIHSEIEGYYERILDIYFVRTTNVFTESTEFDYHDNELVTNIYKLAEITFHGEVVGEDERLRLLLENFGRKIEDSESYVFRDADINEDLPDNILLNQKRKELLLEGDNIFPYLGSYKAFVNAINYFGYSDLRLKEYFYNVSLSNYDEGNIYYSGVEIPLDLKISHLFSAGDDYNTIRYGRLLNNPSYKKTSRFGLYYDINRTTDIVDDDGFPIVEDAFQFTPEEVLIKLFGLKKVLEKYFLPHTARIIDITGEGIYFSKLLLTHWNTITPMIDVSLGRNPEFEAIPLIGKLKKLDKLLNLFRLNFNIYDVITENTILRDIKDRAIYEYIDGQNIDYDFDEKLTYDEFLKFYPLDQTKDYSYNKEIYDNLREDIITHLYKSNCNDTLNNYSYSKNNYNLNLIGLPVELKLTPLPVTFNDLNVTFADINNAPPFCARPSYLESYTDGNYHVSELTYYENLENTDVDRLINSTNGETVKGSLCRFADGDESYISSMLTFDTIGFSDNVYMQWIIKHEDDKYCYTVDGFVRDIWKILIFLPAVGKYDVTCILKDTSNFPNITTKKKYIEVLSDGIDFYAIGKYSINRNFSDVPDIMIKDFKGSFADGYNKIDSKLGDLDISFNKLFNSTYANQDFFENFKVSSNIIDVYDDKNIIELEGDQFYKDLVYSEQRQENTIVVKQLNEDIPFYKNISIDSISLKKLTVDGIFEFKRGERLKIYKKIKTGDIFFSDNVIQFSTTYLDNFNNGDYVKLYGYDADDIEIYNHFKIINIEKDYINNIISLTLEDDGSLNFKFSPLHDTKFKYNYSRWNNIEYKVDNYIFKTLQDGTVDINNNKTEVYLQDPFNYLLNIRKFILSEYSVDYIIYDGIYSFDVDVEQTTLGTNGNTLVKLKDNIDICKISSSFKAYWSDFDLTYALQNGSTDRYYFGNMNNVTFEDLKYQTISSLDFHDSVTPGFRLTNVENDGTIIFNNHSYILSLGNIDNISIDNINYNNLYNNWKWQRATDVLNESRDEYVSKFRYYNIDNSYIHAVAKYVSIDCLFQLKYKGGITGYTDTYPRCNYTDWEKIYFNDTVNNPAIWNYTKRTFYNNDSKFENLNNKIVNAEPYTFGIHNSWNLANSFISKYSFEIPKYTPVILVINDNLILKEDSTFIWELWDDTDDKLLIKSHYPYLIWNFPDEGLFSVKLTVTNSYNTFYKEKLGFIEVVKNI